MRHLTIARYRGGRLNGHLVTRSGRSWSARRTLSGFDEEEKKLASGKLKVVATLLLVRRVRSNVREAFQNLQSRDDPRNDLISNKILTVLPE